MMQSLFVSKAKRATLRKVWAGLLMLSLGFSVGGAGTLLLATNVAHAATLPFSESFSETSGNSVPGWTEVESNPSYAKVSKEGERASSITKEHAHIEATSSISITLDTTAFNLIHVKYYWRGLAANELSDTLQVYWKPSAEATFILLASHATSSTGWSSEADWTLPSSADDASIDIKFVSSVNHNSEAFYVDDISVVGTEIEATPDTTAPEVSITFPENSDVTGPTGTITYTTGDSDSVRCTLDGEEVSCGMTSYVFTLTDGEHTFAVAGTDTAGNTGNASVTWTVDATGPTVTITSGPTDTVTETSSTFTFETELLAQTLCSVDAAPATTCTSPFQTGTLADGAHTFTVYGIDTLGNNGPTAERTWTISTETEVVDTDEDGTPDATDNCPDIANEDQLDSDDDGLGDACDSTPNGDEEEVDTDSDDDGIDDDNDNCPLITNEDQLDSDEDGLGDVCDETPNGQGEEEVPPTPTPTPTPPSGGGGSSTFTYWGCTNEMATNYNRLANTDDGSCVLPGSGTNPSPAPSPAPAGEVLGEATTTPELSLPSSCAANLYLRDYLKIGMKNDPEQVKFLQTFLNEQGANLPVTGVFGPLTKAAVKAFQKAHHDEIIKPWIDAGYDAKSMKEGTGYVYKTTKRYINMLKCKEADIPMPPLTLE